MSIKQSLGINFGDRVHCENEEEAWMFLQAAYDAGCRWSYDLPERTSPSETNWGKHKKDTYYVIEEVSNGVMCIYYGDCENLWSTCPNDCDVMEYGEWENAYMQKHRQKLWDSKGSESYDETNISEFLSGFKVEG